MRESRSAVRGFAARHARWLSAWASVACAPNGGQPPDAARYPDGDGSCTGLAVASFVRAASATVDVDVLPVRSHPFVRPGRLVLDRLGGTLDILDYLNVRHTIDLDATA